MKLIFLSTGSEKCIIVARNYDNREPKFEITDTKRYVPVMTLLARDNEQNK